MPNTELGGSQCAAAPSAGGSRAACFIALLGTELYVDLNRVTLVNVGYDVCLVAEAGARCQCLRRVAIAGREEAKEGLWVRRDLQEALREGGVEGTSVLSVPVASVYTLSS